MLTDMRDTIANLKDPRRGGNTQHSFEDIVLSAFSLFFLQSPSFLEFQRQMQEDEGGSNATTLFGIQTIPTDNHIRGILDTIPSADLRPVFAAIHRKLNAAGVYDQFRVQLADGRSLLPVAVDATQFFSSANIHCEHCLRLSNAKGQRTYAHQMVAPTIVSPNLNQSLALAPEFIRNDDGTEKQDYERAAATRWLEAVGHSFSALGGVILGDDLYSCHSFITDIESHELSYILVCKEESHKHLYEIKKFTEATNGIHSLSRADRGGKEQRTISCKWLEAVPIRGTEDAALVNWIEYTITGKDGQRIYYNTFVTDLAVTPETVEDIARVGRSRWKIENEHHNTLKTKGYHLEHNFGHGSHHLADTLASLNLLAFLMHTVLELTDDLYQQVRKKLVKRTTFFEHVDALCNYFLFESWHAVWVFMLQPKKRPPPW